MNIDWNKLRPHRQVLEREIRALKSRKERGAELRALKAKTTLLYCIVAHARGRLHMKTCMRAHARLGLPQLATVTLADQEKLIGERWKEYAP